MEIAAILGILVGPVTEGVKYLTKPIWRQLKYLCCFSSNKKDLIQQAQNMEQKMQQLRRQMSAARVRGDDVATEVTTPWLEKTGEIQAEKDDIDNQITVMQGGWLCAGCHCVLTRRVKKTAETMEKLVRDCPPEGDIGRRPLPPAAAVPDIPQTPTPEFESRKRFEENVMEILRDERVNVMGICGMGGVGKSTLVEKIKVRVRVEGLFEESVKTVVSQQPDISKIQDELAEYLGLDLKDITTLSTRAHRLHARLTKVEKRILVILDDVWDDLKLVEVGIPCNSHGCTVLLVSRNRDVLLRMDAEPVPEIGILPETEAWALFQQKLGTCLDDQTLLSIAQDVAKECKGLPLALVTVALVLKVLNGRSAWQDALLQLQRSNPEDLPTVLERVYAPLKLSYDKLIKNAKSIFLLCCLFPEDGHIPLEDLAAYAMGLRMFEGMSSFVEVKDRIHSLVETLKNRFLLLEGKDIHHVRMHDVVRDVAIYIASSDEVQLNRCGDRCVWSSTFVREGNDLSNGVNFPRLRLLMTQDNELQISNNFFEGEINLNVLSMTRIYSWKSSLPPTAQLHRSLQTLVLDDMGLETISAVAEFKNLEIFICRNCPHIKMLPIEVGGLVRLKLLEFSDCVNLKRVAPGIISRLVGLEELKMVKSFNGWEAERVTENKERKNAALSELQSLSNLTCLTIQINDSRLAAEQFRLPPNLVKYDICFANQHIGGNFHSLGFERKIHLSLAEKEITSLGNWFAKCDVECMSLEREGSNIVDLRQAQQNMRWLTLKESSTVKKLVNLTSSNGSITTVFPRLEYLNLESIANLEEICHINGRIQEGSSINAFDNLKILSLSCLPALKQWWKSRTLYQHNVLLPQLEEINISDCKMMEQVFLWIEEGNENEIRTIIFPKLKILKLSSLPSLSSFSKGIQPRMDEDSSHLFCKRVSSGTFSRLERLDIQSCGKITSLCSSSIAQNLCNLKKLIIGDCGEMIQVFEDDKGETSGLFPQLQELKMIGLPKLKWFCKWGSCDLSNLRVLKIHYCADMVKVMEDDEGSDGGATHVFPQLQELEMIRLPKLKEFCNWAQMEFPLLRELFILGCPEMERFSSGSLTAPNLKLLTMNFKDISINTGGDLNAELQQQLPKAKEDESFYKWALKVKGMEGMGELWRNVQLRFYWLVLATKDSTQAAEQINFPSNIVRYRITIGPKEDYFERHYGIIFSIHRRMSLNLPTEIILGNWIHECARSVGYLLLNGEGSNVLDLGQAQNLRYLTLGDASKVKKLVDVRPSSTTVFPHLEILNLLNLPSLEEIYHIDGSMPEGSSINAFNNLKEVYLTDLPALKHLWKSNSPNATILQLERLHIKSCEMMEQVFLWNDENSSGSENHQITMIFPNLMHLELSNLPSLKAVCNAIESIKFPLLSSLDISGCPQLQSLVSIIHSTVNDNPNSSQGIDSGDECLHLFCKPEKVDFSGLKKLSVGGYENISSIWCDQILNHGFFARLEDLTIGYLDKHRSLFSSSIVTNLNNLRELNISDCGEMVKVIEGNDNDTDASSEMSTVCGFPKLQILRIKASRKLEMFCGWESCAIELPSLEEVSIDSCPEMKIFSLGSVTAPYQVTFKIDGKEVINHTQDLNVMLQQPVFRGDLEELGGSVATSDGEARVKIEKCDQSPAPVYAGLGNSKDGTLSVDQVTFDGIKYS